MYLRLSLSLICLLSITYGFSQVDTTKLFYAQKFESDAFVELGSRISQVNNGAGMDIDFSVNWLVNHKYYLGAAYSQLASVEEFTSLRKGIINPVPEVVEVTTQVKYQTAGLRFGYILFEDQKVISFSPDLTVGWAGVSLHTEDYKDKVNGAYISPALKGVFNISSYVRLGVAINYNLFVFKEYNSLSDLDNEYETQLTSKALNGVGGGVFLRIGAF